MINFLILILISIYPEQIILNKKYDSKKLPRDLWYEVMRVEVGGIKYCVNQFLASHYIESYWQVTETTLGKSCRSLFKQGERKERGEFSFIEKDIKGISFYFIDKNFYLSPWNFKKEKKITLGKKNDRRKKIGVGEFCTRYNHKCEKIIDEKCNHCQGDWLAVVGDGCFQSHSKICLANCGGRGEPACSQGHIKPEDRQNMVCPYQVMGAICEKGLVAHCSGHIVYCK